MRARVNVRHAFQIRVNNSLYENGLMKLMRYSRAYLNFRSLTSSMYLLFLPSITNDYCVIRIFSNFVAYHIVRNSFPQRFFLLFLFIIDDSIDKSGGSKTDLTLSSTRKEILILCNMCTVCIRQLIVS